MVSIQRRGNSWILRWRESIESPSGSIRRRQHKLSLGDIPHDQAERSRKIKQLELETGVLVNTEIAARIIDTECPTLSKYYDEQYEPWFARQFPASVGKLETCMKHLRPLLGNSELRNITTLIVERWKTVRLAERVCYMRKTGDGTYIREERRPISNETVRKEMNTLFSMLRRAVKWKIIPKLPCDDVEPVAKIRGTRPKYLTTAELERIYAVSGERAHWWRFIANTGLRRSEAFKLRRDMHIATMPGGKMVLTLESDDDTGRTKSGKVRYIPLNTTAKESLKHLGEDFLFPRTRRDVFGRHFRNDARRAGINASIHCLRHSYGTHMAAAGVPLHHLQEYMGHANIATTMIYTWANRATSDADAEMISL